MRYDANHKQEVREKIVGAAARLLREKGLSGVSVSSLMKEVGLTHGGFYNHFENRDDAVAAAVEHAAEEPGAWNGELELEDALELYLSLGHVDHPEQGCVLAALGTDAFRQPGPVRGALAQAARRFIGRVNRKLHPEKKSRRADDDALRLASQALGAVVLARLVDDPALAGRITRAAQVPLTN